MSESADPHDPPGGKAKAPRDPVRRWTIVVAGGAAVPAGVADRQRPDGAGLFDRHGRGAGAADLLPDLGRAAARRGQRRRDRRSRHAALRDRSDPLPAGGGGGRGRSRAGRAVHRRIDRRRCRRAGAGRRGRGGADQQPRPGGAHAGAGGARRDAGGGGRTRRSRRSPRARRPWRRPRPTCAAPRRRWGRRARTTRSCAPRRRRWRRRSST